KRQVDEEDPAPSKPGSECAADKRSHRERRADRRAVRRECPPALDDVRERVSEDRQRDGEHDGGPEALNGTGGVENADRASGRTRARRDREQSEPAGEQSTAPEAVSE